MMAFDPSFASNIETYATNELTVHVKWEAGLKPGPIGEYIEVIDYDPASGVIYHPVDLNDVHLVAKDGLPPSDSDPKFHQQMVYAVAMTTIHQFERALGRVAFWGDRRTNSNGKFVDQFVRRLRIYPHALRDRNAYYSPEKKALLFGYFPVTSRDSQNVPGTMVFTCLSHDIVAHEVTHALLDGVHPRFNEPTNPDVHAFHEAFADLVAVFQHFSYPTVLESQVAKTRGNLETENLLSQLAQQFGRATGRGGALRDALGSLGPDGVWKPRVPDPHALNHIFAPHDRGAILVAAVFRAFLLIYRSRTADLFRIASQGTGILPAGEIHPDLTVRLAREAAKCADRLLQMCIRAIDYCPPVDITFGDFLRGIITADLDVAPEDEGGYRLVFIQAFREWGIHPDGVLGSGVDALAWPSGDEILNELVARGEVPKSEASKPEDHRHYISQFYSGHTRGVESWSFESDRYEIWKTLKPLRQRLHEWLRQGDHYGSIYANILGLVLDPDAAPSIYRTRDGFPSVEVHSVRPAIRRTLSGEFRTDLVVEITQRRRGYFDPEEQKAVDTGKRKPSKDGDFKYRAGCTILIDPVKQEIRRVIRTPGTVADDRQLERVRRFLTGEFDTGGNAFDAGQPNSLRVASLRAAKEPFAFLHQEPLR